MNLAKAELAIGVRFNNKEFLMQALTHRSYLNEHRSWPVPHNERLEFLGDAVLELIVTDFLVQTYPEKQEGELTAVRAALVNTDSLAETSKLIGINDFLLLSKGESKDTGRARHYLLANTLEAIIGAIYLDQGYEPAKDFVSVCLFPKTQEIVNKELWRDPKSKFQELMQARLSHTPTYKLEEVSGPDHSRSFVMGVYIGTRLIAKGTGASKKAAETKAAELGIIMLEKADEGRVQNA